MHDVRASEIITNYELDLRNNRGRDVFLHIDLITWPDLMRLIGAIIHANDLANALIDITVNVSFPCVDCEDLQYESSFFWYLG